MEARFRHLMGKKRKTWEVSSYVDRAEAVSFTTDIWSSDVSHDFIFIPEMSAKHFFVKTKIYFIIAVFYQYLLLLLIHKAQE